MKRDRLYGITLYLLNHKRCSANELAAYFEVSLRSIQRDIDCLSMAGVPIIAYQGVQGGYEIQESFRMEAQLANQHDYAIIVASLEGLTSAFPSSLIQETMEKLKVLQEKEYTVKLDFSIANENPWVKDRLTVIEQALHHKRQIRFTYTNAAGKQKEVLGDPIVLLFKWYAWYLIAFDQQQETYRMYKVVRMENIQVCAHIANSHERLPVILEQIEHQDSQVYLSIKMLCGKDVRVKVLEYFQGEVVETYTNGDFLFSMCMPEQEHFWYANVLGMGTSIRILEPITLQHKIYEDCKKLMKLYEL